MLTIDDQTTAQTTGEQESWDADTLNHYMLKADIFASLVTGTESTALCGYSFLPKSHGNGNTSTAAPICMDCEFIFSGLETE